MSAPKTWSLEIVEFKLPEISLSDMTLNVSIPSNLGFMHNEVFSILLTEMNIEPPILKLIYNIVFLRISITAL
jgi:hypothetical protein